MRRLLLVTNRPLQHGGPVTARWGHLIDHLPTHGWEVAVVTSRSNPTREDLSDDPRVARMASARARTMGMAGRLARPITKVAGFHPEAFPPNMLWSWTARRMLSARAGQLRPDAVIATSPPPSALFATAAALADHGLPLVAEMRDPWAEHPLYDAGGRLLRRLEGGVLDRFDAVVAVTDGMIKRFERLHPQLHGRLAMLPNGFDPALLDRRARRDLRDPDRRVTLIHAGVLYGGRRLDGLLAAIAQGELAHRIRLELIGNLDGPARRALATSPPELEVAALGPRPWAETMDRVAASDVVVAIVPAGMGDDVAWPVKVLEGLALGKPILAITGGGGTETLLAELGLAAGCARDGDATSIAAALGRLLDDPPPPVAPRRLERWNRATVAREYAKLLDGLIRR